MAKRGKNKEAVAIAEDVIAQIQARQYVPMSGVYVDIPGIKPGDLQQQLMKLSKRKPCQACALGSAFISAVRLYDDFEVPAEMDYNPKTGSYDLPSSKYAEDINDGDTQYEKLGEFFTQEELGRIESLFELNNHFKGKDQDYYISVNSKFPNFYELIEDMDDEDRLMLLMREVIRQNGGFSIVKAERQAVKILSRTEELREEASKAAIKEVYDAR